MGACNSASKEEKKRIDSVMNSMDFNNPTVVKFNNKVFGVPSPIQIASLAKEQNIGYNQDLLNSSDNYYLYNESFKQALNLGVYGADLSYANMYEQYGEAKKYFSAIKKLSEKLEITNTFSQSALERLEKNNHNQDSVFYIISSIYQQTDASLLYNNRKDVGVLILAGGWIESLHFLMYSYEISENPEILDRICAQKQPINNLLQMLTEFYGKKTKTYDTFVEKLAQLEETFSQIESIYTYAEPTVFKDEKLTIINSTTDYNITEEQVEKIKNQIASLRKYTVE